VQNGWQNAQIHQIWTSSMLASILPMSMQIGGSLRGGSAFGGHIQ
jgi:hypothetical protein